MRWRIIIPLVILIFSIWGCSDPLVLPEPTDGELVENESREIADTQTAMMPGLPDQNSEEHEECSSSEEERTLDGSAIEPPSIVKEQSTMEEQSIMEPQSTTKEQAYVFDGSLCIVLDPGHGGVQSGAEYQGILEKDVNMEIAQYLKKELEQYDNVTVYLTHEDDEDMEIDKRVSIAAEKQADLLVSLHNNAKGEITQYDHGCTVLVPRGVYREKQAQISQEIACCILQELEQIGITNQGLMFRICQNETTYPNGALTDYYGIVRNASLQNIPGILIEHAFLDHDSDRENFLSDSGKLQKLARADADGIARYYGLSKNGERTQPEPAPYQAYVTQITTDSYENNKYFYKDYFAN